MLRRSSKRDSLFCNIEFCVGSIHLLSFAKYAETHQGFNVLSHAFQKRKKKAYQTTSTNRASRSYMSIESVAGTNMLAKASCTIDASEVGSSGASVTTSVGGCVGRSHCS